MRATGDRWQNMECGVLGERSIQPLEVADMHAVEENIDERAKFAGLVAEVEAHARIVAFERVDYGAYGAAGNRKRGPAADKAAQGVGQVDQHMWCSFARFEGFRHVFEHL
jgi:hypothetical protein